VVTSAVEVALITVPAAFGERIHINDDDVAGIALQAVMGATIFVLYLATVSVALRFLREHGSDPTTGWGSGSDSPWRCSG
jgi:hypothetical protein